MSYNFIVYYLEVQSFLFAFMLVLMHRSIPPNILHISEIFRKIFCCIHFFYLTFISYLYV